MYLLFRKGISFLLILSSVFCYEDDYNPLRDLKKCKLTHSGTEYKGDVARSFSGLPCQYWDSSNPLHAVDTSLKDDDFPDRSKKAARNYCRNPNKKYAMPWCYTLDPNVIDDVCDIPLCSYEDCRITGPGMEYSGHINRTASDRACVPWSEKFVHKYEADTNATLMPSDEHKRKLPDYRFPEGSRKRAMNRCRNPNADPAGPWCLVERETLSKTSYDVEYCNVPFCEQPECPSYTSGDSSFVHTHYSSTLLSEDDSTILFGLRLWNPEQWRNARFRLALSMVPIAATGKRLREMNVGLELLVQHNGSELQLTDDEEPEFSPSDSLIVATAVKYFAINWAGGFISFGFRGNVKPLWIQEYNEDVSTLIGLYRGVWKYVSILGVAATWSFPFCKEGCVEHITLHTSPSRLWPLKRAPFKGYELSLYVRAHAHAIITLRPGPGVPYPSVSVVLAGMFNKTVLTLSSEKGEEIVVTTYVPDILTYWKFTNVKITVIGDKLQAYWSTEDQPEGQLFLSYEHLSIRKTRWFSIASQTVAHWTLYCQPNGSAVVPKAVRPECIMDDMAQDYNGTQWVSAAGNPCLPWNHRSFPQMDHANFPDKSKLEAENLCRNPTKDPNGPYCFTMLDTLNSSHKVQVKKEYCKPRFCQSAACKISGLGTDFFGLKSSTRSGRACQSWLSQSPHKIDKQFQNDDLYPTRSVKLAQNYCRNPSRDVGGPWCYTKDPKVQRDLCDVTDCEKSEQCTLVVTSSSLGSRNKYILPDWRTSGLRFWLKVWDPRSYDTLHIVLSTANASGVGGYFDLIIGYNKNEYLALMWTDLAGEKHECDSILLPHLIAAAKWTGFWLKLSVGAIQLGRDGASGPIFQWEEGGGPCPSMRLDMIGFYVEQGGRVAASFDCTECHTEVTHTDLFDQKYPVDMWKAKSVQQGPREKYSFFIHVRSTGEFKLGLFRFPMTDEYLMISFSNSSVLVHGVNALNGSMLKSSVHLNAPVLSDWKWSVLKFEYSEQSLNISKSDSLLLQWNPSKELPLIYYYMSISSAHPNSRVTWTLNCVPPDIDGAPRSGGWGGWGPWQCSVPCGGGSGIRYRKCDHPKPNIFGAACDGSNSQVGRCNTFKCGEISPYTSQLIRASLKREARTIFLTEANNLSIACDMNLVRRIANESPTADFEWNKNGFRLGDRVDIQDLRDADFTWNLTRVHVQDSGVYTCLVFPDTAETRKVLSVVIVTSATRTFTKRVGDRWKLVCNSGVLASVYRGLQQRWLLNGRVYVRDKYVAIHSERDEITHINTSHEGVWECQVFHHQLNLTWTTNWTRLHVLGRASIFTHLMEDRFSGAMLSWLGSERNVALFVRLVPLVLAVAVLICLFFYRKWEKEIYGSPQRTSQYQQVSQGEKLDI
ncbi:hypothetical protein M8J76_014601 [Diaphorina citri]|nr:hypothetical protein M8J76_014601 [Diaphorina citri]